jgi:hypothetical protein
VGVGGGGVPGQRAAWLDDAARTVKRSPQIKAMSYFDTLGRDDSNCRSVDWRLHTEASAMAAFKRMASDAYFQRVATR